jgi:hypothetical protein
MPHVRERQPFPDEPTNPDADTTDDTAATADADPPGKDKDGDGEPDEA